MLTILFNQPGGGGPAPPEPTPSRTVYITGRFDTTLRFTGHSDTGISVTGRDDTIEREDGR